MPHPAHGATAATARVPHWRGPRRSDMLAAAVLLVLLAGMCVPWVLRQWHAAGVLACQNNMSTYGAAMVRYSDQHQGQFPRIEESGCRSFAGMFVPLLRNAGLLADTPHLLCGPRQAGLAPATVEDMEQLWQQADRDAFQRRARHLAGNYAYTLGYRDDAGILHGLRHNDPYQPILADHCPAHRIRPTAPTMAATARMCSTATTTCAGAFHPTSAVSTTISISIATIGSRPVSALTTLSSAPAKPHRAV